MVNSRETLTRVRLPEEKVASARDRSPPADQGIRLRTCSRWTPIRWSTGWATRSCSTSPCEQIALPQTIEFPEEEFAISIQSMSSRAERQIISICQRARVRRIGQWHGEDHLLVKTSEGAESIRRRGRVRGSGRQYDSLGSSSPVTDDSKARRRDKAALVIYFQDGVKRILWNLDAAARPSCASCPSFASRGACACARCRRRSTSR